MSRKAVCAPIPCGAGLFHPELVLTLNFDGTAYLPLNFIGELLTFAIL
jgi:hypothetical protein